MVITPRNLAHLQAECMDGTQGYSASPMWLSGTARVRWSRVATATSITGGSSGGGRITALRWFHNLGDERVGSLVTQDPRHFASECRRVINQCLRFRQWPVKDNGNETGRLWDWWNLRF